jgi:hypothetical protein
MRKYLLFLILVCVGFAAADIGIDNCYEFTSNEKYYLTADVLNATPTTFPTESCMSFISVTNITLDCQGHSISYPVGGGTSADRFNTWISDSSDILIKNCVIRSDGGIPRLFTTYYGSGVNTNIKLQNVSIEGSVSNWAAGAFQFIFSDKVNVDSCSVNLPPGSGADYYFVNNFDVNLTNSRGRGYDGIRVTVDNGYEQTVRLQNNIMNNTHLSFFLRTFQPYPNPGWCFPNLIVSNNTFPSNFSSNQYICNGDIKIYTASNETWQGNYWGPCVDIDTNGWCDEPYNSTYIYDAYPLSTPDLSVSCTPVWGCTQWSNCIDRQKTCLQIGDTSACNVVYMGIPSVAVAPQSCGGGGGGASCGDNTCTGPYEDQINCPADCGAPLEIIEPPVEEPPTFSFFNFENLKFVEFIREVFSIVKERVMVAVATPSTLIILVGLGVAAVMIGQGKSKTKRKKR